ncbi:dTDP-4-dehydrorhamnose 3,5-epimerase family protein, partial [Hansschlegelia zhihuaiae]
MDFIRQQIPDVVEIRPRYFRDARGYFSETYKKSALAEAGVSVDFVQDNKSLSTVVGTIRGLHFQLPPFAQGKLVS